MRLRVKAVSLVLSRLGSAQHELIIDPVIEVAGHQVAEHVRYAERAAAIIAKIDHQLASVLRAEIGKGSGKIGIGWIDKGAQIDIAHAPCAVLDDPRAISVGDRVQRKVGLGEAHLAFHSALVAHAQNAGETRRKRAKRLAYRLRSAARHQAGDGDDIARIRANAQNLRATINIRAQRRCVFEGFQNEDPIGSAIIFEAEAETRA